MGSFLTQEVSKICQNTAKGDFGIEIEMECNDVLPRTGAFYDEFFYDDEEHSLKNNGYEFVFPKPENRKKSLEKLAYLSDYMKEQKVQIIPTIRASTHVHLNMTDSTVGDVYKLAALYYPLETVLTRFCGQDRQNNLFCLRARDASFQLECLEKAVTTQDINFLHTDDLRYSALNFQSLFKYGSLEFRALKTLPDFTNVPMWLDIITRLKTVSKNNFDVWGMTGEMSLYGPSLWLEKVFGKVIADALYHPDNEKDIMSDMRNCQMLLHEMRMVGL
jgi:hypothetical protein